MLCWGMSDCCEPEEEKDGGGCGGRRFDWLLWGSLVVVVAAYLMHLSGLEAELGWQPLVTFVHGVHELMAKMWWGIVAGIVAVGIMHQVPREAVMKVMGRSGSTSGIVRAMFGGLALDLCNHGILLVAMKLYERGASLGQVYAFLIASPWNSFTLTLILIGLIGLPLTLLFILLSAVIALVTGILVEKLIVPPSGSEPSMDDLSWREVWQRTRESFPEKSRL